MKVYDGLLSGWPALYWLRAALFFYALFALMLLAGIPVLMLDLGGLNKAYAGVGVFLLLGLAATNPWATRKASREGYAGYRTTIVQEYEPALTDVDARTGLVIREGGKPVFSSNAERRTACRQAQAWAATAVARGETHELPFGWPRKVWRIPAG